jgi:hypothetical protein
MTANPFSAPATSSGISWADLDGLLLMIEPLSEETGIPTVHGEAKAIRANVVVLDGPNAGERHDDTLVFPKVLSSQLRPKIGEKVLGRLGQGQKKPGQSAPWILNEATEADVQIGVAYLAQSARPASTQPASSGQPF